jgi:hypothetical protein
MSAYPKWWCGEFRKVHGCNYRCGFGCRDDRVDVRRRATSAPHRRQDERRGDHPLQGADLLPSPWSVIWHFSAANLYQGRNTVREQDYSKKKKKGDGSVSSSTVQTNAIAEMKF